MIDKDINKNIGFLDKKYGINDTFDIVKRHIKVGKKQAYLYMIDGFAKDHIMSMVIQRLQSLKRTKATIKNIQTFVKNSISYTEVEVTKNILLIEEMFLSGAIILYIDGETSAIIIDAREYPIRSVTEPDLERVTRGPRDGFVETLIFNTALIRRRVKDPNLRFKLKVVGRRTKTNIAISYLNDLVDKKLLKELEDKIDTINLECLVMAEKSLVEFLIPNAWINPLPKVRYTERPDVVASHLFEGHIVILVDTTPSAIIIPTTIFHFTQHAEDYYQVPIVGTYIRLIRHFSLLLSLLLIPLWFLMSLYPDLLPSWLYIIKLESTNHLPVFAQLLILEFSMDLLKISSIHTPSALGTSLGIVGGLILGNYAIEAGLFTGEAILITALTAIATFATPSIEFGHALRIFRLFILFSTAIFKWPGFVVSLSVVILTVLFTKNGTHTKYTYPLFPLNLKHLVHVLFRMPIPKINKGK